MTLERCPETSCGAGRAQVAFLQQLTASGNNQALGASSDLLKHGSMLVWAHAKTN